MKIDEKVSFTKQNCFIQSTQAT